MEMESRNPYQDHRKAARQDLIEEELYGHPGIQTPEQKISFIRNAFNTTEEEFVIEADNEAKLNETFAFVSYLDRRIIKGKLPEIVRNKAEKLGGKNLLEALQQDDVSVLFDSYIEAFNWSNTG